MSKKCKEMVCSATGWGVCRCSRNAVRDGYCKQHHPDARAERERKADERYEDKRKKSAWYKLEEVRKQLVDMTAQRDALLEVARAAVEWFATIQRVTGVDPETCDWSRRARAAIKAAEDGR